MKSKFMIFDDGKKKYQDFWLNARNATQENFQTDVSILNKLQEKLETQLEKIVEEKERLFNRMKILSDECIKEQSSAPKEDSSGN